MTRDHEASPSGEATPLYARHPLVGKRVRLVRCTDEYTRLTPGEEGVVTFVDALGSVAVKWESGSSLSLIPGEDAWEVIS
jgi:hypothetical protein